MKKKVIFLGSTLFSQQLFDELILDKDIEIVAIFSIPEKFNISYSKDKVKNYNYHSFIQEAQKYNIKRFEVDSNNKKLDSYEDIIKILNADILLVLGWYYMIPKNIRELAKYGAWGIHASLLPNYAGGAPLTWAIINGEKKTGVTLFKMDDGVDNGPIIAQNEFLIEDNDTIKEVYEKATIESKKMLKDVLKRDFKNIVFKEQDQKAIEVFPQRNPNDGQIDLSKSAKDISNFIRAQSSPYPGAFIKTVDNKKLIIEKARVEEL